MSAVRSSELCGPCRRGSHGTETPTCAGLAGVDLDHAEQTLRRLQAEQAAAEPATQSAVATPGGPRGQRAQILGYLAEHSPFEDEGGGAVKRLGEVLGMGRSSAMAARSLAQDGLVGKEGNSRRVYRIWITEAGLAALGSSAGPSVADGPASHASTIEPVGGDNPTGAVADGPADEPSGVSGGQGSPRPAVSDDVPPSVGPFPEAPADAEMALLAEQLRRRLRRSLVLAVEPFVDAHRDEAWFGRLFDLFDLGEREA